MKSFSDIQNMLKSENIDLSGIKKIYLLGTTGAGKTSLVKHIINTSEYDFPSTTQSRTTVSPTEYVIKKDLPFKTTIILKDKDDICDSIILIIQDAIQKALENFKLDKNNLEDIISKLEESSDERFRLKYMIQHDILKEQALKIQNIIIPLIADLDTNNETLFLDVNVQREINDILNAFLEEIEICFSKLNFNKYKLFSDSTITLENFLNKDDFIKRNKELLKNDYGSLSLLVEYVRIEGNLLANWLPKDWEFVLIDGEGIGHSLREKRDTLSVRHYNFFDYCNNILLIEKADDPFISGGQGAIETIFLNGYKEKFKLVFSKMDTIKVQDKNSFIRKRLSNLDDALKKQKIIFGIQNTDTFKIQGLDSKYIDEPSKKEIQKLFKLIIDATENETEPLEYDFNSFFSDLNTKKFLENFRNDLNDEHWMTIKAFSNRMYKKQLEFKNIKPISEILTFIMENINEFLQRDDQLHSNIAMSQNRIKQLFSKKLILFIYQQLIMNENHLWRQTWEEKGQGSHERRKDFMFKNIFRKVLPYKEDETFDIFRKKIKEFLIESGAKEMASATSIILNRVCINKVHSRNNFYWNLSEDINILIGKNGTGKSTILKLINACINSDSTIFDNFSNPSVDLMLTKYYEDSEKKSIVLNRSKNAKDINSIFINFNELNADEEIDKLLNLFNFYINGIKTNYLKKTETIRNKILDIEKNISTASIEKLQEFQKLRVEEDQIKDKTYSVLHKFKKIIDLFYKGTNKEVIFDELIINNPKISLIIKFLDDPIKSNYFEDEEKKFIENLSSGEKQILIILLTVLIESNKPFILLMDEPEISLHVEWQSILIESIRALNSTIQIIIATHNPLMLLNRKSNEIGILNFGEENIFTETIGTKYLDISSILLNYFKLSSLIGSDMQKDINKFTKLKLNEKNLSVAEKDELENLKILLENNYAGDIIYNTKYFMFLNFLKDNKNIDFDKYEQTSEEEMAEFLKEFGDFFND